MLSAEARLLQDITSKHKLLNTDRGNVTQQDRVRVSQPSAALSFDRAAGSRPKTPLSAIHHSSNKASII